MSATADSSVGEKSTYSLRNVCIIHQNVMLIILIAGLPTPIMGV